MKKAAFIIAAVLLLSGCGDVVKQGMEERSKSSNPRINPYAQNSYNTQTAPVPDAFPPKKLVEKVEILASDSTPLPQDSSGTYMLNLFVGSEYQIKAKILPEDAQDKSLTYEVETYKDCITISDTGFLTVLKKPNGGNRPYIRIEGSNGKFAQVKVEVTNDVDSIIKEFNLRGSHAVTTDKKTGIEINDGSASTSTLTIKKGTKYSTYQYSVSNSDMVEVIKTETETDTVDTYTFTVKENKSAWTKEALISFYAEQNSKKIPLREIKIVQKKNPNMKKTTQWVHGITEPPVNKLYTEPFKYDTWGEDETTNWFNARKLSYTGTNEYPDTQLCWAMTTANMLHWWFTQNEGNIKKYMEKKGISPNNDFYKNEYKKNVVEKNKSSFANQLRAHTKNYGSLTQIGLQWYLEGQDSVPFNPNTAPKLFTDVLSSVGDNSITTRAYLNNKNDMNTFFKEAIKNKEAIAVSYESTGYPAGHVVTVWGISLDGEGNVIELWVADSDIRSTSTKPFLYNMGVAYDKSGIPMWYNTAVGQMSNNRYSLITRLGLGKDKFESFFDNNPQP